MEWNILFSRLNAKVVPNTQSKLSRIGEIFQLIAITMKLLQLISDIIPKKKCIASFLRFYIYICKLVKS